MYRMMTTIYFFALEANVIVVVYFIISEHGLFN